MFDGTYRCCQLYCPPNKTHMIKPVRKIFLDKISGATRRGIDSRRPREFFLKIVRTDFPLRNFFASNRHFCCHGDTLFTSILFLLAGPFFVQCCHLLFTNKNVQALIMNSERTAAHILLRSGQIYKPGVEVVVICIL